MTFPTHLKSAVAMRRKNPDKRKDTMTIEDIIAFHEGEAERLAELAAMNPEAAIFCQLLHQSDAESGRAAHEMRFGQLAAAHRAAADLLRKLSADT